MIGDLVAELNHLVALNDAANGGPYRGAAADACVLAMRKAADRIEALEGGLYLERNRADNLADNCHRLEGDLAEAVKALRPFAALCDLHVDDNDKDSTGVIFPGSRAVVQVGHLRAARALVEQADGK